MTTIDSYHPPPPLVMPVTEQPKPGITSSSHFPHPSFDRTTTGFGPKTLESLAERVHPFYGLQGPGQMTNPATGRASTLGRTSRGGVHQGFGHPGTTMSLMRGGRLTRSGSDQRIPVVDSASGEFYEYANSSARSKSGSYGTSTPVGRLDAASRLGLTHRRRTSIDYASDTEASISHRGGYTRRGYNAEPGSSGSWKAPPPLLGLGMTPTTPTMNFQPSQYSQHSLADSSSRSNSLPRGNTGRYRREVHFDASAGSAPPSRPAPPLHHHLDSLDDSDGAVSAPELSEKQKQLQRLSQQHRELLYGRPGSSAGGGAPPPPPGMTLMGSGPTGNFTSAEYKAWMQRAPSTSAIYERLRQGREAIEAHRAAKLTFSAENLVEKAKQV